MPDLAFTVSVRDRPLSAETLDAVQEIEVDASLEAASTFRLRIGVAQEQGDWTVLKDNPFAPLTPVAVRLQARTPIPEALLNGFISHHAVTYGDRPGESVLEVSGMDATLLMNAEEKVKAWENQADGQIASSILSSYNLTPRASGLDRSPVLSNPDGTTIQRGTDIRFLRRLAARNGFECYVQPEPSSGVDFGYFGPPQLSSSPQAVLTVAAGEQTNVRGFTVRWEMTRPAQARTAAVDARTKRTETATKQTASEQALGSGPALGELSPAPLVRVRADGLTSSGDLQRLAQALVDRSSWALVAEGELATGMPILRPGKIVNVRGAGRLYDGSWYVTRVRHRIDRRGYAQRFEARRNAVRATGAEVYAA